MVGRLEREQHSGRHYSPAMHAEIAWANHNFPNAAFAYMGVAQYAFDALLQGEMTGEDVRCIRPTTDQLKRIGSLLTHDHRSMGIRKVHEGATPGKVPEIHISDKKIEAFVFDGVKESAWILLIDLVKRTPAGASILDTIVTQRSVFQKLRREIQPDEYDTLLDRFAKEGGQWRDVVKKALQAGTTALHQISEEDIRKYKRAVFAGRGYGYELSAHEPSKMEMVASFNGRTRSAVLEAVQGMHLDPSLGFDAQHFSQVAKLGN